MMRITITHHKLTLFLVYICLWHVLKQNRNWISRFVLKFCKFMLNFEGFFMSKMIDFLSQFRALVLETLSCILSASFSGDPKMPTFSPGYTCLINIFFQCWCNQYENHRALQAWKKMPCFINLFFWEYESNRKEVNVFKKMLIQASLEMLILRC